AHHLSRCYIRRSRVRRRDLRSASCSSDTVSGCRATLLRPPEASIPHRDAGCVCRNRNKRPICVREACRCARESPCPESWRSAWARAELSLSWAFCLLAIGLLSCDSRQPRVAAVAEVAAATQLSSFHTR